MDGANKTEIFFWVQINYEYEYFYLEIFIFT